MEEQTTTTETPSSEQPEAPPQQNTEQPPAESTGTGEDATAAQPGKDQPATGDPNQEAPTTTQPPADPSQVAQIPEEPAGPVEIKWPAGIEGMDYDVYAQNSLGMTVRHEITYGDILVSTLLAFLIIVLLIQFFHRLILGGKNRQ